VADVGAVADAYDDVYGACAVVDAVDGPVGAAVLAYPHQPRLLGAGEDQARVR
jgi:hypothetical protein